MLILETPRILLREMQESDAESFYELNLDKEVIRYTGDVPFASVAEAKIFIQNYSAYKDFGYGRWIMVYKTSNEVIGFCGLKYHPEDGETDIGFRLRRDHWGIGLATEAAVACMQYGFGKLGLKRIIARAHPENVASIRVVEKLGMLFEKEIEEHGELWNQYAIEVDFEK